MTRDLPQSPRLSFKRAFIAYLLELHSPGIADPTAAFAACRLYLGKLREQLGAREFMNRLDDETTSLAGQVEQDLRQQSRGGSRPAYEEIEERVRECFEHALGGLDVLLTDGPVQ